MASVELKNVFLEGRMNKDTDERLLKKGEYRDAENIRVVKSDGSNAGSIENVKGNEALTNLGLTNALTIGVLADEKTDKIFWMTTSDEKDILMEYNKALNRTTVVLESSKPNSILNFSRSNLITGIVLVANSNTDEDLLGWTDDLNPPRLINIKRSKTYGADGFTDKDINLIQAPPKYAPTLQFRNTPSRVENNLEDKFLAFSYRYKYLDGGYSALSSFTNYAFTPEKFKLDPDTQSNQGMINTFNSINIVFNTGDERVTDVEIFFKESGSYTVYKIESFNKVNKAWGDNEEVSFLFFNNKNYIALPEDELFRRYDNVPLRAKALEFINNRLLFGNYVEGYDMIDSDGQKIFVDYNLYIENNSLDYNYPKVTITTNTSTDDELTLDFTGIDLKKESRLTLNIILSETTIPEGDFDENMYYVLDKDFANAQELSTDPNFINFVTDAMTDVFDANNTGVPPTGATYDSTNPFTIVASSNVNELKLKAPSINYITPVSLSEWGYEPNVSIAIRDASVLESVKTNRDYEVAVIYEDEYKRSSPALTSDNNTIHVPQTYSNLQNKIMVSLRNRAPSWAKTYKFAVKESRLPYNTIYTTIFYEDGNYRWCRLEGSSKDKVNEGDILIVKSDTRGILDEVAEVEVLEIKEQSSNFIEGNIDVNGDEVKELSGLYMKVKPNDFNMDYDDTGFFSYHEYRREDVIPDLYVYEIAQTYDDVGSVWVDTPIPANSVITISFSSSTYDGSWSYNKTFVVNQDRSTFDDFWKNEVVNLGTSSEDYEVTTSFGSENRYAFFVDSLHHDTNPFHKARLTVDINIVLSSGVMIFETKPDFSNNEIFHECSGTYDIIDGYHIGTNKNQSTFNNEAIVELDFFNCYVQGNGAESNKYKDLFNSNKLLNDIRPSVVTQEEFKEVRRRSDLTYSEVYNESTNLNGLNEFNLSRHNYKDDLDKGYGSIQKLHARDTDVVVIQQDKWSKVLYGKDMLYNADGSTNVTFTKDILNQQVTFKGEYGISNNPESFAYDGHNIYASDTKRGAILRLGLNGLTEIVSGMKTWFKDLFKASYHTTKVAGFDPYHDSYKLNIDIYSPLVEKTLKVGEDYELSNAPETSMLTYELPYQEGNVNFEHSATSAPVKYIFNFNGTITNTGFITTSGLYSFYKEEGDVPMYVTIITEECGTNVSLNSSFKYSELNIKIIVINDFGDIGKDITVGYTWAKEGFTGGGKEVTIPLTEENVAEFKVNIESNNDVEGAGVGAFPAEDSQIMIYALQEYGKDPVFIDTDKIGYREDITLVKPSTVINIASYQTVNKQVLQDGREKFVAMFSNTGGHHYLYLVYDLRGVYVSAEISESIQSNIVGCVPPNVNSWVTYTLEKGAFTSTTSQFDADSQARTYFDANKQAYADANGECILEDVSGSTLSITSSQPNNGIGTVELQGADAGEEIELSFNATFAVFGSISFTGSNGRFTALDPIHTSRTQTFTADSSGKIYIDYQGDEGTSCTVTIINRDPMPISNSTVIDIPLNQGENGV